MGAALLTAYKKPLAWLIVTLSLGWIGMLVHESALQLMTLSTTIQWSWLLLSGVVSGLGQFATALVFFVLIQSVISENPHFLAITIPFFLSRVGRYLPGKLFGFLYQIHAISAWVRPRETIEATLYHFFLVLVTMACLTLSAVAGFRLGLVVGLGVGVALTLILYFSLHAAWFTRLLNGCVHLFRPSHVAISWSLKATQCRRIIFFMYAEWCLYLLAWQILLPSVYTMEQAFILAVTYIGAWFVGFLFLIVPSGLGVRESSFVTLGGLFGFDPASLLLYSLLFRLVYLIGELLSLLIGVVWLRAR